MIERKPLKISRISQAIRGFVEGGDIFGKAVFLWTMVFSINVLFYLSLSKIIINSDFAHDYLSPDEVSFFLGVVKVYLLSSIIGYLVMAILKVFQKGLSDHFLYCSIFLACLNYTHLCCFFGGLFVILAPLFLIVTITNICIFFNVKMGKYALFCSVILFVGCILLNETGYFPFRSVVLNNVRFNDILTNQTIMILFSVIFSLVLLVFGYIIVNVISSTEQKKQQAIELSVELEKSNKILKEIDVIRTEFLMMVSHDLRTPLTNMIGYTNLLRNNLDKLDRKEQNSFLEIIESESNRLNGLISDLLDLQQLETGMMKFNFENFDIIKLINESIKTFIEAADSKNIGIQNKLPTKEILLRVDRQRISQVIDNLLSNAIKFTPKEGQVKIGAEMISENGNSAIKVAISDTGPGIAKEFHSMLFDEIKRVYQLDHVKEKGSGLGLAIVKEIIKYHNGRVGIESEVGKGSTFYFVLPIKM